MGKPMSKNQKSLIRSDSEKHLLYDELTTKCTAAEDVGKSEKATNQQQEEGKGSQPVENSKVPKVYGEELDEFLKDIRTLFVDLQHVIYLMAGERQDGNYPILSRNDAAFSASPSQVIDATSAPENVPSLTTVNSTDVSFNGQRATDMLYNMPPPVVVQQHPYNMLRAPNPLLTASTTADQQNSSSSTDLSTQQPVLCANYPLYYNSPAGTDQGCLSLKYSYKCSDEYTFLTPGSNSRIIYSQRTSRKSKLCAKQISDKFEVKISGITAITQRFNFIFVLRKSGERIQCLRYNAQLQDKLKLFTNSAKNMSSTALTVSERRMLTVIGYVNNEVILESYDIYGTRLRIINLPNRVERLQNVISLKDDRFLLHFEAINVVREVRLDGRTSICQWQITGYKFYCVTADQQDQIYGVARVNFLYKHPICVLSMNKHGTILAVEPLPELENEKVTTVTRIDVNNGYVALQCDHHGTYVYKLK